MASTLDPGRRWRLLLPFHFIERGRVFPSCHSRHPRSPSDLRAPTRLNTSRRDLIILLAFVCAFVSAFGLGLFTLVSITHFVILIVLPLFPNV